MSQPSPLIAVCLKITVDVKLLAPDPRTGAPDLSRCPLRVSDLDENAIEAAVQLKERHGGEVWGISVSAGEPRREVVLRALAMGLDALHVAVVREPRDPLATADLLTALVRRLPPLDLIVCGETSVDGYRGQGGPRLAEALGIPSVASVLRIALEGREVEVDRLLEDRIETWRLDLPALLTVGAEINQPRLPSVLHVMGASRKPVTVWQEDDLGVPVAPVGAGGLPRRPVQRTVDVVGLQGQRKRVRIDGETPREKAERLLQALAQEGEAVL